MDSPKKYFIRTHGCQMNEHDSERIAGLLAEDGMTAAATAEDADLILFNTCCIRENADEKLYGQLTSLKPLKDSKPDLQIAVGGCLAQKDRDLIAERAPFIDVVFGTHNLHRVTDLLDASRAANDPIVEIFEEHEAYPSALPARREVDYAAWITIQIGCDNSCTFCIVP
ncbi:MAG: tRNA (N6-isopentenyl adenosine(37)-C2)-methylthiotransferase MiaB, partial [Acidimicrobiia bacterium]